ncbi:hypothetical protein [Vibrio breoganii]|uniref:Uncharacterized protein n=1 Tax=Vibrio breoganii TaxID=553239 RepID=A0ABX1U652_9VIBR|nr:hypothetical protein [Vibrio breoganii]NMO74763.1 hypothetical protein [Vibrio breoganii]NMR68689.1 hypothetical protein [Vibrio breoganii]PML87788.1 hypothetical protein BCT67_10965 [Vibrio breoganii]
MNYTNLQLDETALSIAEDILSELECDNGWFKMTARIAAQIDSLLKENGYTGTVVWFSDADLIEHQIDY